MSQRTIELLEELRLDGCDDETKEFAVRPGEFAREIDRPEAGARIAYRRAEERAHLRPGLERCEISLARHVRQGDMPAARAVDDLAVCADQQQRLEAGEALDLLLQHRMDVMSAHGRRVEVA